MITKRSSSFNLKSYTEIKVKFGQVSSSFLPLIKLRALVAKESDEFQSKVDKSSCLLSPGRFLLRAKLALM